jgi:hypothetical protein
LPTFTTSFPSGHATLSAITYLTLGALLASLHGSLRFKIYFPSLAILLAIAVGTDRCYDPKRGSALMRHDEIDDHRARDDTENGITAQGRNVPGHFFAVGAGACPKPSHSAYWIISNPENFHYRA